jgi:hypothetical protein
VHDSTFSTTPQNGLKTSTTPRSHQWPCVSAGEAVPRPYWMRTTGVAACQRPSRS